MPEALQVRLNLLVYLILLLPLILTEEGGARGAIDAMNISIVPITLSRYIIIMSHCCHFDISCTVTVADLKTHFLN